MRELIYKDEAYKAIDNCIRDGWDRISPSEAKMNIHHLVSDVNETDRSQKVIAQITFDEEKLREIVKEAVERFKEEYEITDRPLGEWIESFKRVETMQGAYLGTKFVHDGWSCSECSEVVEKRYPNCPYCLSRMKGTDNDYD